MANMRSLIESVDQLKRLLKDVNSPRVNSERIRAAFIDFVDRYFIEIRGTIDLASLAQEVAAVDGSMRELHRLSHARGSVSNFRGCLTRLRAALITLHQTSLSASSASPQSSVDAEIIRTLSEYPTGAAASYQQAVTDLRQSTRLSWRGPATDLREALRETLDHLAPDSEVTSQPGYRQEPDASGPTMRQKVTYILRTRELSKHATATVEQAVDTVDLAIGKFVRSVYQRSNISTHTPTNKAEVMRVYDLVRVALCEVLEIHSR